MEKGCDSKDIIEGTDPSKTIKDLCPTTCEIRIAEDIKLAKDRVEAERERIAKEDCEGKPTWCEPTCVAASKNEEWCGLESMKGFYKYACCRTCGFEESECTGRRQLSTPPHDDCDGSDLLGCYDKCFHASRTEKGCDSKDIIEGTDP